MLIAEVLAFKAALILVALAFLYLILSIFGLVIWIIAKTFFQLSATLITTWSLNILVVLGAWIQVNLCGKPKLIFPFFRILDICVGIDYILIALIFWITTSMPEEYLEPFLSESRSLQQSKNDLAEAYGIILILNLLMMILPTLAAFYIKINIKNLEENEKI